MIRKVLLILLPILFLGALIGWLLKTKTEPISSTQPPGIVLTNLSSNSCPKNAWLVVMASDARAVYDSSISVMGCNLIPFPSGIFTKGAYRVLVKIPRALAFEVVINDSPVTNVEHGVQLGDLTNDNAVDEKDKTVIENALTTSGQNQGTIEGADLDGDNRLTVLDLALVSLNQGTGLPRPDGTSWGVTE